MINEGEPNRKLPKNGRWFKYTNYPKKRLCYYHVTYQFQSESTIYSCLNVKELLARSRHHIFLLFFIPWFDYDVVVIIFGFYFSNAKGWIVLFGLLYMRIYCGVNCCSFSSSKFLIWSFIRHKFHVFSGWCSLV